MSWWMAGLKTDRLMIIMDEKKRGNIFSGMHVSIVQKKDQASGKLTKGVVKDILTKSSVHQHGIKVRLETGEVGRVKIIH